MAEGSRDTPDPPPEAALDRVPAEQPTGHGKEFLGGCAGEVQSLGTEGAHSLPSISSPILTASNIIRARASGVKWPVPLGASIDSFKTSWKATKDAYEARKGETLEATRGLVHDAVHKSKNLQNYVKEQVHERASEIVNKAVSGLDVGLESENPTIPTSGAVEVTNRWWTGACEAVRQPHDLAGDPPEPPMRARMPRSFSASDTAAEEGGADAESPPSQEARGCLEVELLHFSNDPPLTCPDGSAAISPVCQLALGGRYTGALRPRTPSASRSGGTGDGTLGPSGSGASGSGSPSKVSAVQQPGPEGAAHRARFAISEIAGCDLRVHVFDANSRMFSIGMEDRAFCGGAFVPLSSIVRHHSGPEGNLAGLLCRTVEAELAVKLLPLDAIRLATKLRRAELTGLERPAAKGGLGYAVLRARLTFYDRVVARTCMAVPYCGVASEVQPDYGQVQNPMSILKATGKSMERVSRALKPGIFLDAVDQLKEGPLTAALLYTLWTYTALLAPLWRVPGCCFIAMTLLAFQISGSATGNRHCLYKDELDAEEEASTTIERNKKRMTTVVRMELRMMKFAKTLTRVAVVAEKIRYLLSLQDMQLSVNLGGLLLCGLCAAAFMLWAASAVLGGYTAPFIIWTCGCLLLLPAKGRARALQLFFYLKAKKERVLGPGNMKDRLVAMWCRIPDGPEAQHCDLAERYVVVC